MLLSCNDAISVCSGSSTFLHIRIVNAYGFELHQLGIHLKRTGNHGLGGIVAQSSESFPLVMRKRQCRKREMRPAKPTGPLGRPALQACVSPRWRCGSQRPSVRRWRASVSAPTARSTSWRLLRDGGLEGWGVQISEGEMTVVEEWRLA